MGHCFQDCEYLQSNCLALLTLSSSDTQTTLFFPKHLRSGLSHCSRTCFQDISKLSTRSTCTSCKVLSASSPRIATSLVVFRSLKSLSQRWCAWLTWLLLALTRSMVLPSFIL